MISACSFSAAGGASAIGMQLGEHLCTPVQYLPLAIRPRVTKETFLIEGTDLGIIHMETFVSFSTSKSVFMIFFLAK
jgi:hypothetical protein